MNDQVTPSETAELLQLASKCLELEGDYVELGCYRGDTSVLLGKLLAQNSKGCGKPVENSQKPPTQTPSNQPVAHQAKKLWLYDSFAGLPAKTIEDASGAGENFQAGELLVTKREVVTKIKRAGLHNTIIKKAWFDELTDDALPEKIAFAFLDGDLYSSLKTSLKLVAPRMVSQGIIVVHDYNNPELPGSARAVDEFLRSHPEYRLTVHYTLAIIERTS